LSAALYNAERAEQLSGHHPDLAFLKRISPVAWQHINFHRRYEFNKAPEVINIDSIIQTLASLPIAS
jgi:hypothetical protein